MAKVFLETSRKQLGGVGKQQSKETPMHRSTLALCIVMAKGFVKTSKRRRGGIGKQQSKDTPMRKGPSLNFAGNFATGASAWLLLFPKRRHPQ
jgi:hypothetical protein